MHSDYQELNVACHLMRLVSKICKILCWIRVKYDPNESLQLTRLKFQSIKIQNCSSASIGFEGFAWTRNKTGRSQSGLGLVKHCLQVTTMSMGWMVHEAAHLLHSHLSNHHQLLFEAMTSIILIIFIFVWIVLKFVFKDLKLDFRRLYISR